MSGRRHHGGTRPRSRVPGVTGATADAWRPVRAGVFAAVCVVTTALGHALMSDDALPWWAVGLAFTGTACGAWWLTGPERGAGRVVGATVLAQGMLHLLFSLAHHLVRPPGAEHVFGTHHGVAFSDAGMAVHHPGTRSAVTGASADSPLWSVVAHGSSAGMFLAHLLAAVVCGLWLWRGEAAVHRIGRVLAALLFAPLRRVCGVLFRTTAGRQARPCRGSVGGWENPWSTSVPLRHAVVRRGPPRAWSTVGPNRMSPVPPLTVRP